MMKHHYTQIFSTCLVLFSITLINGCGGSSGPDLVPVSGVVTLDGAPLDGAQVTFVPQSGRSVDAVTESDGSYTLKYSMQRTGAEPGDYTVSITTQQAGFIDESGGGKDREAREELLPAKYHEKTELKATVEPGGSTIDFPLKSK